VPELIIFVGLQGSGKTTYYHQNFAATHVHVSKDLMPNARNREARQRQMIEHALAAGESVVVDNTNPTPAVRQPLIEMGRRHGARVAAYFFDVPVKVAVERNRARQGKARVPDVAVYVTAKKLKPPVFQEGFDEVRVIAAQLPLFAGGGNV
jgi:predicted kinase